MDATTEIKLLAMNYAKSKLDFALQHSTLDYTQAPPVAIIEMDFLIRQYQGAIDYFATFEWDTDSDITAENADS